MASNGTEHCPKRQKLSEDNAVTLFRDYLRIQTVHPDPDYDPAVVFLTKIAQEIGLDVQLIEVHPGKPVLVCGWEGKDKSLPSILLYSHTDVVPVFPESWRHDPFEAVKEANGDIYARGSQDMKCVGIQYLEAVRRLKQEGKHLLRNIYLTFMPEEEVGGHLGIAKFIKTDMFKEMKVGFGLDEGLANPGEEFTVYNGQRSIWWIKFTCKGKPGHGSRFIEDTAVEKVRKLVNQIQEYRESQKSILDGNSCLTLGNVTTCNINMINGGVAMNVVPENFVVGVDIRIAHSEQLVEFEKRVKGWIQNAGSDISYEFVQRHKLLFIPLGVLKFLKTVEALLQDKIDAEELTSIEEGDPWWDAFSNACKKLNIKTQCEVFPAGTDSSRIRKLGIPVLGFSPMNHTPILLHDHNEFLNEDIFLNGIDIYYEIIQSLANVSAK
eukprot:gene6837-7605_t